MNFFKFKQDNGKEVLVNLSNVTSVQPKMNFSGVQTKYEVKTLVDSDSVYISEDDYQRLINSLNFCGEVVCGARSVEMDDTVAKSATQVTPMDIAEQQVRPKRTR